VVQGWLVGVAMLAVAAPVAAQGQPQSREVPPEIRTRQHISTMEAVLERAVVNGATNMVRQLREQMGEPPMLSGPVQVRGHRLEGYGVFFDVGVPLLRMPIMWTVRQMTAEPIGAAALSDLRELAPQLQPRERARLEELVRRLEFQLTSGGRRVLPPSATLAAAAAGAPVVAADALRPPVAPVDPMDDPAEAYTREVKAALLEAMLEHSGTIELADHEWLVVAARDNVPRDPLMPGDLGDFTTVQFRISGSDLAALRERRLTLEEAQRRVIVREY
jgi:hypothetical protein